jgi:sulfur relay (sulfurtransferase) DsrC/TusE family protein
MRIEIDKGLEKLLDQVKEKELGIYGRGHVETVRFLANYYLQHKPLEVLRQEIGAEVTNALDDLEGNLERSLQKVFPKALAQTISNILTLAKDENPPEDRSAASSRQPRRRR